MVVNRSSSLRLATNLTMSLANKNESRAFYSLSVKDFKIGSGSLDKSNIGVPLGNRIGRKGGPLSFTGLWTLASPYGIPNFDLEGQIFINWPLVQQPFSWNGLMISASLFFFIKDNI